MPQRVKSEPKIRTGYAKQWGGGERVNWHYRSVIARQVQVDKPRYLEWQSVHTHRVIPNDPTYHVHASRRQKLSRQNTSR